MRLPPGHTPPCGLQGAPPSSATEASPVSPLSLAVTARGACLPGTDPPFQAVPVTPGKAHGQGGGVLAVRVKRAVLRSQLCGRGR